MVRAMRRDSELIWHYTTSAGLHGVVVNHRLRATSVSFVNDPSEQRFGLDAVLAALGRLGEHNDRAVAGTARAMTSYRRNGVSTLSDGFGFSDRMVACASRADDSLDMWRAYGAQGISGTFAIGLDPLVPLGPLFADSDVLEKWVAHWGDEAAMPHMREGWIPMNYVSPSDLEEHAYSLLLEGLDELDSTAGSNEYELESWRLVDRVVAEIEARYKHNAYAAERELRLQATLTSRRQFQVVPRPQGISAFLEMTASTKWGCPVSVASRLPIREVVLWPGAPRQAFSGVAAALVRGDHNYSSDPFYADPDVPTVRIRGSEVPFV